MRGNWTAFVLALSLLLGTQMAIGADWVQGELKTVPLNEVTTYGVVGNVTISVDGSDIVFTFNVDGPWWIWGTML